MAKKKFETMFDFVVRMTISLAFPIWGAVMIGLGAARSSGWWGGCGVVVFAVGMLLAVGNPIADRTLREL